MKNFIQLADVQVGALVGYGRNIYTVIGQCVPNVYAIEACIKGRWQMFELDGDTLVELINN